MTSLPGSDDYQGERVRHDLPLTIAPLGSLWLLVSHTTCRIYLMSIVSQLMTNPQEPMP